jgi:hypothetical protein
MISVNLTKLYCHQPAKGWSKGKPYLWTLFFSIDGSTIQLTENFRLSGDAYFHFSEGSHRNLEKETLRSGEVVAIPEKIGHWQTEVQPIKVPFFNYAIPGMIGVVVILMMERNVTEAGAEAGHKALNDFVEQAVNQAIGEFDVKEIDVENIQPSIKEYFARKTDNLVEGVEDAVKGAIVQSQNIFENLWTFFDQDELVGYQVWDYNQAEIEAEGGFVNLKKRWTSSKGGDWEIHGQIYKHGAEGAGEESPTIEVDIEDE